MCFIGVCVTECLNEPLCVGGALVRKPEEKEPGYLCSLQRYLIHFQRQKKRAIQRPGMGRESPFHTQLVGNFSSILCMPFAYDPFFSQRSLRGRNPRNACRIHQIPLSRSLTRPSGPRGPRIAALRLTFLSSETALVTSCHARSPWLLAATRLRGICVF